MNTYTALTNDFMFKKFFGSPEYSQILRHFCQDILDLEIASVTVTNPFDIGEFKDANRANYVVVDISAQLESGERITIEMQNLPEQFYLERCRYYVMGAYRENYGDADLMLSESKYSSLRQTYGIYVQDFKLYSDNYALEVWELYRRRTERPVKDERPEVALDEMYFFNLQGQAENDIHRYWQQLFKEGTVDPQAPNYIQETAQAIDIQNLSAEERVYMERYEDLQVRERERIAYAEQMAREGMEERIAYAEQKAREEEREETREEIEERVALDMLRKQADIDFILEISKLSLDKLKTLAKQHNLAFDY